MRGLYGILLAGALRFGQLGMTTGGAAAAFWTWSPNDHAQGEDMRRQRLDERVADLSGSQRDNAARAEELRDQGPI